MLRPFWVFVHDFVAHPLMAIWAILLWTNKTPAFLDCLHDYAGNKAWPPKERWWILVGTVGGWRPLDETELEARPGDAQPTNGDAFTPWHQKLDHLHYDYANRIIGAHILARTRKEAEARANELVNIAYVVQT